MSKQWQWPWPNRSERKLLERITQLEAEKEALYEECDARGEHLNQIFMLSRPNICQACESVAFLSEQEEKEKVV